MKHIWSVICNLSSIDQESNNISLFNCLEQLNIPPFKGDKDNIIPISMEVISLWRSNEDADYRGEVLLELFDPKNKKLLEYKHPIFKPKGMKRLRTKIKINGLPFTDIGEYVFKIKIDNLKDGGYALVSELPLEIQYSLKIK